MDTTSSIGQVLAFNRGYVAAKGYEKLAVRGFIIDSATGELTEVK